LSLQIHCIYFPSEGQSNKKIRFKKELLFREKSLFFQNKKQEKSKKSKKKSEVYAAVSNSASGILKSRPSSKRATGPFDKRLLFSKIYQHKTPTTKILKNNHHFDVENRRKYTPPTTIMKENASQFILAAILVLEKRMKLEKAHSVTFVHVRCREGVLNFEAKNSLCTQFICGLSIVVKFMTRSSYVLQVKGTLNPRRSNFHHKFHHFLPQTTNKCEHHLHQP